MILLRKTAFACIIIVSLAFIAIETTNYSINKDYKLKFSTTAASGTFSGLKGKVVFSPADLVNSKIDVTVDAATINTGNSLKDTHAKSEDWLNTGKFPLIRFRSNAFEKINNEYSVTGVMELHGVSKTVTIPLKFAENGTGAVFTGTFSVNREDFGITGNGLKGKIVGNKIDITFNIPVSRN